ncbi:hypothetical protein HWV07_05565 [Natronomonas salina]|uniref:hypothetical protein n=1 Tax=Natronomonas salina TaxID=1710540 RepID=UPI0015B44A1E|nr:hypothetical protein [Natronomonas salina]QLD88527.1 hypothetical protein HWV07_05565 [Natronomonas salina]
MTRVPITDDVVEQLREVLDAGVLDDEFNYMGAQFAAQDMNHEELAEFVYEADAATYYEAVQRAKDLDDGD